MTDDSKKKDDDGWNFEVKGVKTQEANIERQKRKERLAERLGQKEEKRDAQKDLMAQNTPKKMALDGAPITRKSRTKLAEEMKKADEPDFTDLIAGPVKRGLAFAIDAGIFLGMLFVINSQWERIELIVLQVLRDNEINQTLSPDDFKMAVFSSLGVFFYSLFMALPACFTKQSWGKNFIKLSIQSADENKDLGFFGLIFREFIAKPISIATVVGPLLCLFNPERKTLHDMVAGTVVMDDSN